MSRRLGSSGSQPKMEFPDDLFTSLRRGDVDDALDYLRAASIDESGEASPTAKKLMESGEWDLKELLSLVYVDTTACPGKVGTDGLRFCGKAMTYCNVAAHPRNTIGKITRGWYISFGKGAGVLLTPFLPAHEDGGPIDTTIGARLSGVKPFKLTRGQWKFVIDAWHALKVIAMDEETVEFSDVTEQMARLNVDTTTTSTTKQQNKGSTETTTTQAQSDMQKLADQRMQKFQLLMDDMLVRVKVAEDSAQRSELKTRELESAIQRLQRKTEEDTTNYMSVLRRYREKVENLEEQVEILAEHGGRTEEGPRQALLDKVEVLDTAMFAPTGAFARFKDSFIEFRDRMESGGGIECNGVSFGSYNDFMAWFNKRKPKIDVFLDGLAYMHAIRAPVVHKDDATKQRELQQKTSMTTALEQTVITSFDTILPSVLVGSGGKRGENGQGGTYDWLAGYLKSYEVWKPIGTNHGVSHQIVNGINSVSKRITELRKQYVDSDVVCLSVGLCTDSATFCQQFVQFINTQQEELTNNTAYSEDQVWQMQLECIEKIVVELSEAREAFVDSGESDRGNLIWGMLMAWQIQQRYLTNHFKDDPALTGVLVRRILMQGQDQSVKKKMAKIDTLEVKVNENKNHATSEIGKVKAELVKVKEELSKLAKK